MRPEKLRIQNFGPFRNAETVDFSALGDIFLVTGKTGSGKTTIFDALCFALFGSAPGSRQGHTARLRSDYAGEGEDCRVSLEFTIRDKRYLAERSPRQEKPKKRGSGFTVVEETAALYEFREGAFQKLNLKKSETDEAIKTILGLSRDEFFKIVLLPQGEFAEFLKQNTTERQKVLGKLFPVEKAAKLREIAREKAKDGEAELREAALTLEEIAKRINFTNRDELKIAAREELEEARSRFLNLSREIEALQSLREKRLREEAAFQRLRELEEALRALEAQAPFMAEKEGKLALSRKARPLEAPMNQHEEKRRNRLLTEEEFEEALAEAADAGEALAREEAFSREKADLERELGKLRELKPKFEEAVKEEELQSLMGEEKAALAERIRQINEEKDRLEKQNSVWEAEILNLEGKAERYEALSAQFEEAREVLETLNLLQKSAGEGAALEAEIAAETERLGQLEGKSRELNSRIPTLEAELEGLRREKEAHERANMAAVLGITLAPGEPCPVCGSREHPLPSSAPPRLFGYDERIQSQENALKDARQAFASGEAERRSREEALGKLAPRLKARKEEGKSLKDQLAALHYVFDPQDEDPPKRQTSYLNALVKDRTEAQRSGSQLKELGQKLKDLQKILTEREKELALFLEKDKTLSERSAEFAVRREALRGEYEATAPLGKGIPKTFKEALSQTLAGITLIEETLNLRRNLLDKAGRASAAAKARTEERREKFREAETQSLEAAAQLEASLAGSPFQDQDAAERALLPLDAEDALAEELDTYREERSRLEFLKEEAQRNRDALAEELAGAEAIPLEALGEKLETLKAERDDAEKAREEAGGHLTALEQDEARLIATAERYERLKERNAGLIALSDDLAGKNPKKRPFDAWLLGRYLAETALYANSRLEKMSESRYSLILSDDQESGNAKTGLDLAVFDAYTGKRRPCATLSGGESFMASISLALGLADSIQNRSGGVQLDAVFIDEGFGSLDEVSLDRALVILDEIREQRMVGIVSHVGELRARIPSRIEVVKSGDGSRIIRTES